jgi:integrase
MLEAIDIHHHTARLDNELKKLAHDERLLPVNRELLARFVADARIGRAVKRGARRRISVCRCRKYLTILRRVAMELSGSLEDVTASEMERFILGVEDGTVRKLSESKGTTRYSPETVRDFKKIIRRFYKYLWPEDEARVEDLTGWFDTRKVQTEHRAFAPEVVPRLARAMGDAQGQALVWLLFDGGFRIGELLNVRLSDVWFKDDAQGRPLCFVRVRVSKTFPRTVALPMATEAVAFWIQRHPQGGPIRADGTIDARDASATLIRWTYRYCGKRLRAIGDQELGERLYAHRFRHTSATYYAARLNPYPFCARFGWAMGSAQAERYISRSGLLAEQAATVPHSSALMPSDPLAPAEQTQSTTVTLTEMLSGPVAVNRR